MLSTYRPFCSPLKRIIAARAAVVVHRCFALLAPRLALQAKQSHRMLHQPYAIRNFHQTFRRFGSTSPPVAEDFSRNDVSFQIAANEYLHKVADAFQDFESKCDQCESLEAGEGSLEFRFTSGEAIVINKHYIHRQLWYSSPVSGADYFDYESGWTSSKTGLRLDEQLMKDIDRITKRSTG